MKHPITAAAIADRLNKSGFRFRKCKATSREKPGFVPSISWQEEGKTHVKAVVLRNPDGEFTNRYGTKSFTRAPDELVLKVNCIMDDLMREHRSKLKFREDWERGQVVVYVGRKTVYRSDEYTAAATWARDTYKLIDAELMRLYRSYKENYDAAMA